MQSLANITARRAGTEDLDDLRRLVARAARTLSAGDYSSEQIEAALRFGAGVNARIIEDGTYYVIERCGEIIAGGGWSFRAALVGGSHPEYPGKPNDVLDAAIHPARLRGFFVDPRFARRGLGRTLVALCEGRAADAGFRQMELMASLTGRHLYLACGYEDIERTTHVFPDGVVAAGYRMHKTLRPTTAEAAAVAAITASRARQRSDVDADASQMRRS
jgi:GNAT superfamily N-acetyltransferase